MKGEARGEKEHPRRFGLVARLLLVPVGLLVGLLVAEFVVRATWDSLAPLADVRTTYNFVPKPFEGRGFFPPANSQFESIYDGDPYGTLPDNCTVTYRLNEVGFRDDPFPPGGRRGEPLIAVLGDSFVFGEGVGRPDRFTNVCERALGGSARVLNLGVSGYSSEDERDLARAVLPQLRPDIVVLGYCLNDPIHPADVDYTQFFGFDMIMRRDEALVSFEEETSPLYLLRLLQQRLQTRRITSKALGWYLGMYEGENCAWKDSREHLQTIKTIAEQAGAKPMLFVMPLFHQMGDYPLQPIHDEIRRWCAEVGLPVLDTQPLFVDQHASDLVVHPKDRHPNATAHRIFGEALAEFLQEGILD